MRWWPLVLVRIVFWAALFLAIFAVLTILIAFGVAFFRETAIDDPANLTPGVIFSLAIWLFMALFHLRKDAVQVPFVNRESFLHQIKSVGRELGYVVVAESREHVRLHPSFTALLMGGGILVRVDEHSGIVVGPRMSLRLLRRRLRLHQQLAWPAPSQDSRRRHTDPLLSRVQVSLRLPPDRWPEVLDHLIDVLGKSGKLTCELHMLSQNPDGLRDSEVEENVRNWLHERGIPVEIHKDHVQFSEPGSQSQFDPPLPV